MKTLLDILVRLVVTGAIAAAAGYAMTIGEPDDMVGANIGIGLAAFLAIALVSLIWSFLDARGERTFLGTVALWLGVGLLIGALGALQAQGFSGDIDRAVLWDDFKGLSVFGGVLAAVPAVVGAAVGSLTERAGRN